jgi:hypothetical protein
LSQLFESFDDGNEANSTASSAFGGAPPDGLLSTEPPAPVDEAPASSPVPAPATTSSLVTDEEEAFDEEGSLPPPYTIPDFEKDDRDLSAYEDAKRRHIRQQIASSESAIQTSFAQKREQLQREIKNARSFEDERRGSAMHTTRQYANSYPHRVDKRGINPPSFFENLLSLGRAGRLYRAAFVASEALEQLRTAMRKREEALGALEGQMSRAIYLKEDQIRKTMESESGLNEFHERPEIKPLFTRVDRIKREREEYQKRLERGDVSDEEQRDRAMSEQRLAYAALPIMGAIVAKVARFGQLAYFQLRDLEKHESLLSYDPRLDPLRNCVFDIYAVAGTVAAKLKRNDNGTAFRVADHFKACWRNQDKAEELYSAHRSGLREDRGLTAQPPRDDAEAEIISRLANLAQMVEGSSPRPGATDTMPPPIPSAPAGERRV